MLKFALLTSTAILLATGAHAADLSIPAAPEVISASASGLTGYVEAGVMHTSWTNTNEDDGDAFGAYGEFGLWYAANNFKVGVDGYIDGLAGQQDEDDVVEGVRVLGGHAGMQFDNFYAGVFGAVGWAPDEYNEEYVPGYAAGVEAAYDIGEATLFGHVGYADVRVDELDSGFTGVFGDFGIAMNLTDSFGVMVKGSGGYAPENFADEDEDDNGLYAIAEIKAIYMLPVDFPLALTASYELGMWAGPDENDTATTSTVKVGLSIPFGAESPKDALHVLSTPTAPFRMGAWGDKLD